MTGNAACPIPKLPDRFGVVWPDGAVFDCTPAARLFDQDPEGRARMVAATTQGRPVRIVTELVDLTTSDNTESRRCCQGLDPECRNEADCDARTGRDNTDAPFVGTDNTDCPVSP